MEKGKTGWIYIDKAAEHYQAYIKKTMITIKNLRAGESEIINKK